MVATPLTLPSFIDFTEFKMRIVDPKDTSMLEGRRTESASFSTAYWTVTEVRTNYLEPDQIDELEAFFFQAQRGGATFVCPDFFHLRPRFYGNTPLTFGVPVGSGTVFSLPTTRQATITGLLPSFVIKRGDLVEFRKSTLAKSLHKIVADVTAGIGGTAVINFEPPLNTTVFNTANSVAVFERPSCVMMLTDWDIPRAHGQRYATFSAMEAFFS